MLKYLALILIAFGGGVTVGTATSAFISILLIVPRLAQITDTREKIHIYRITLVISSILAILAYFFKVPLYLPKIVTIPIGLFLGIFTGLLSSALAEVLNVIPVLSKRLKIKDSLKYVVWALLAGKVVGSLVFWILLN